MAKKQENLKYPNKGWSRGLTKDTDERIMKMSIIRKGKKYGLMSEQGRKNLSEAHKGKPSSCPFKKGRIPWNKGLNKSDPRVADNTKGGWKLSKGKRDELSVQRKGRKIAEQTKLKMSIIAKQKGFGKWMKGKSVSNEVKLKISETHKKLNHPALLEYTKKRKGKSITKKNILGRINYWTNNNYISKPEKALGEALKQNNIVAFPQYPIRGIPDFFIKPNICIFVDGDYWHGNPKIKNHVKNIDKIKIKDANITKILKNEGYIVLRLWEKDINENVNECINQINNLRGNNYA